MNPVLLQLALFAAMTLMFVINAMAGAGIGFFKGQTNGDISRKHDTKFTPDGWAFSIWSVIFISLAILTFYLCQPRMQSGQEIQKLGPPLILNFVSNAVWGIAFSFEVFWLSILIMLSILGTLLWSYKLIDEMKHTELRSMRFIYRFLVFQFPISIYTGWISVATIANFSIFFSAAPIYWTENTSEWSVVLMITASLLAFLMLHRFNDVTYASVCVWALIAISTKQKDDALVHAAALGCATGVAVFIFWTLVLLFLHSRKSVPGEYQECQRGGANQ